MLRLLLIISLAINPLQDIGGSLAFQGQDIIGGAAIIFKAPQRVRDIVGGAASMMAVRRPPRSSRSTQVARNTATDRNRPPTQPTTADASTATAASDRVEALMNQGNTYYDSGQFAQALDLYQNAVKLAPQDPDAHSAVGDTYLSLGRFADAASAYEQTVRLQRDNSAAYSNLGFAYDKLGKTTESIDALRNATTLIQTMRSPTTISAQRCTKPAVTRKQSKPSTMLCDSSPTMLML